MGLGSIHKEMSLGANLGSINTQLHLAGSGSVGGVASGGGGGVGVGVQGNESQGNMMANHAGGGSEAMAYGSLHGGLLSPLTSVDTNMNRCVCVCVCVCMCVSMCVFVCVCVCVCV